MLPGEAHMEVGPRDLRLLQRRVGPDGWIEERAADSNGSNSCFDRVQRLQEIRRLHDAHQDDAVDDGTAAGPDDQLSAGWDRCRGDHRSAAGGYGANKEAVTATGYRLPATSLCAFSR